MTIFQATSKSQDEINHLGKVILEAAKKDAKKKGSKSSSTNLTAKEKEIREKLVMKLKKKAPQMKAGTGGRKRLLAKRKPISFQRKFRLPGRRSPVLVSSKDLVRGVNFLYKGKSYKLTLRQIFAILRRKNIRKGF